MTNVNIYSKEQVDTRLANYVRIVTALPTGKTATDTVTFQDLIDMDIIVIPSS